MKTLRTPRFWLLTTAALMLGAHGTANAQSATSYNYGTPTMVAAAPGLPSVAAEQIARDVTQEVNPRTGQMELAAAPFDPFEDDPSLAGSLQLRSADGGLSIDGQPLQGGAIVDVNFYYNSPSDDPFGGRNYGDASFVNGQLAPIVTRDTRILECSTRVENVVYDHTSYYARSPRLGIYRPYRHYIGHSGFGFGFGTSYFGPGFGFYNSNRRNFSSIRRFGAPRVVRGYHSGNRDGRRDGRGERDRSRDHDGDRERDRDRDGRRGEDRAEREDRSESRQGLTSRQRENRLRALEAYGSALPWSGSARRGSRSTLSSATPQPRIAIGTSSTSTQSGTPKVAPQVSQSDLKSPERRSQARRGAQTRASRVETTSRQVTTNRDLSSRISTRSAPSQQSRSTPARSSVAPSRATTSRSSGSNRSSSRSSGTKSSSSSSTIKSRPSSSRTSSQSAPSRASSRSKPSRSSSRSSSSRSSSSSSRSKPSRSSSSRNTKSRQLNFFPSRSQSGRQVVTSQSVDCAREDTLRVFIPNDRLDAARFDGLTLIALDARGGETPIYIPPNYIEGFQLASSGRIQPQGYQQPAYQQQQGYQAPQPYVTTPVPTYQQPSYPYPSGQIEAAPCPAGTTKQADGTCLQASYSAYPTQ